MNVRLRAARSVVAISLLLGLVAATLVPGALAARGPSTPTISCNTQTNLGSWEDALRVYVGADSATSNPYLAVGSVATGATQFQLVDATSGATRSAASITSSGLPTPATFSVKAPLSQNYYLNLSKPVIANIWLTSAVLASTHDNLQLRFELWLDSTRIGGQDCFLTLAGTGAAWHLMSLRFRPEVAALTAGSTLSLRVYTFAATADLHIGTGGSRASFFEFRYFPTDPLSGPVLVQDGKRTVGVDQPPAESAAWMLALAALPGLFLFARRPRRAAPALVAALVVAMGFAGCLSDGPSIMANEDGESAPPTSTAEVTVTENETLQLEQRGVLAGRVQDDLGFAVAEAHVLLMGTNLFSRTDKQGGFSFLNLTAGGYVLRVDKQPYLSLEQSVTVEVGKETFVSVRLARPAAKTSNFDPHIHDMFDETGKKLLWDGSVSLTSYQVENAMPAGAGWLCVYGDRCEAMVPIDVTVPMPPGTSRVEVIAKFSGVSGYQQMGLRILTPVNSTTSQDFVPRGSGDPFRIAMFPEEADPGHQQFTNWVYYLWIANTGSPATPFGQLASRGGAINVHITAYKGIVPYEPAHKDLWGNLEQMVLVNGVQRLGPLGAVDYPRVDVNWRAASGSFVPTGTLEVRGTLAWASKNGEPMPHTWSLVYKSARYPQGSPVFKKPDSVTAGTNKIDFVIKVDPFDVDPFYAKQSQWFFYPDDGIAATALAPNGPNFGAETKWTLTAVAYRDPAYEPS